MTEIRRIIDSEPEAEQTVELWDRMCRETPDGGPLTPRGRQNLKRMLAMQAWHRESFCLVAVEPPPPDRAPATITVTNRCTRGRDVPFRSYQWRDDPFPGFQRRLHQHR